MCFMYSKICAYQCNTSHGSILCKKSYLGPFLSYKICVQPLQMQVFKCMCPSLARDYGTSTLPWYSKLCWDTMQLPFFNIEPVLWSPLDREQILLWTINRSCTTNRLQVPPKTRRLTKILLFSAFLDSIVILFKLSTVHVAVCTICPWYITVLTSCSIFNRTGTHFHFDKTALGGNIIIFLPPSIYRWVAKGLQWCVYRVCMHMESQLAILIKLSTNGNQKEDKSFCLMQIHCSLCNM